MCQYVPVYCATINCRVIATLHDSANRGLVCAMARLVLHLALFGIALSVSATAKAPANTYLECTIDKQSLVFAFRETPPVVFDVQSPNVEFSKINVGHSHINFTVDNIFYVYEIYRAWDPEESIENTDTLTGTINRITSEIELRVYADKTPEAVASCKAKTNGWWCEDPKLTGARRGVCRVVGRHF